MEVTIRLKALADDISDMNRCVCILGEPLASQTNREAVCRFVHNTGISDIVVITLADSKAATEWSTHQFRQCSVAKWTWSAILNALAEQVPSASTLVLCPGNAPFLNLPLYQRLLHLHETYAANFTFADAYPFGLGVDLLDSSILRPLASLAERQNVAISEKGLFDLIRFDVNAFDVETEIANDDMRLLRLAFVEDNAEHRVLIERFKKIFPKEWHLESPEAIAGIIRQHEDSLRLLPAWFSIQLHSACPQVCTYCPYGIEGKGSASAQSMDLAQALNLVNAIAAFNANACLSVSLWGEPALYPHFEAFTRHVLETTRLELYIETAAISWDSALLERLANHPEKERLYWIASLDSADPQIYRTMRGEGFTEAWQTARKLHGLFLHRVWFQAVRCTDNENQIQEFYQLCKDEKLRCIVQKFDHFSHQIADKRVSDIGPYSRFPCWHAKRDMYILLDGTVPLCREDLQAKQSLGNAFSESLETIWARGESLYLDHIKRSYKGLCENCDEYYTFNA